MEPAMLRDSNEKNQPSVFRFDDYPGQSNIYSSLQEQKYMNSSIQLQDSPIFSSFIPQQQMSSPVAPQVPSSFSFGSSTTNTNCLGGQFPFQITNHEYPDQRVRLILGKRKTDSPSLQPYKQHITEEKMAEHMSKLHISSETAVSALEPDSVKNKRLYMCEEMRKLQNEPLLPAALVAQIQRPCTALVLWQPPTRVLPILSTQSGDTITDSKEDSVRATDDPPANGIFESVDMDNELGGSMDLDS